MAPGEPARPPPPRLAELIAALSLGIDLGFGQPMEHVLRQCIIALRIAEHAGLDDDARLVVYYTALLINVGCHTDAHEQAKWFGDDIAVKATKFQYDMNSLRGAAVMVRRFGSGNPPLHRFRLGLEFLVSGHRDMSHMVEHHAEAAESLADQVGLPEAVQLAVGSAYEQWDGKGWPDGLKGEQMPIAARIAQMSEYVEVSHRVGGIDAAVALARARSGKQFDPAAVDIFCAHAREILDDLDSISRWSVVVDGEPALGVHLTEDQFDDALDAVATFIDLKSPYFLGHARAVADLVERAGAALALSADEVRNIRRAGLAHGFGRLGISNSIWDKPGKLGAGEWERVRLQPYLNERMLRQASGFAPFATTTTQFRERLNGSGYPHGLTGGAIPIAARLLGVADAYQAMREPRPHRPLRSVDQAASELRDDARAGRFDGDAVDAVLKAAGQPVARRERPAGLTAREVEVLRLVSRGMSSKQIAAQLVISPKTARNHIEHIYTKIGASSRVGASLFAMQNGLLVPDELAS